MNARPMGPLALLAICCASVIALFIGSVVAGFIAGSGEERKPTIIRMKIVEKPRPSP